MAVGDPYVTVDEFQASVFYKDLDSFFDDDTQLENFLINISDMVDGYCRRHFWQETKTDEEYLGKDKDVIMLKNYPVLAVSGIVYEELFTDPKVENDLDVTYYEWTRQGVLQHLSYWDKRYRYKVTYVYGYDEVPADIKVAVMKWAKILADSVDTGNLALPDGATLTSFKFGKFMETYATGVTKTGKPEVPADGVPQTIQTILRKYRRGGR